MSNSWPFQGLPNWLRAMPPAPLKGSCRTHFCSFLCLSTAARSSRYKWSHRSDYSSKGLRRDRNVISHPNDINSQIHCSWDSTNTARHRSKDLGMADVHTGPGSSTHTDIPPGRWGEVTWEKAFCLVWDGTAAAAEVPGSLLLLLVWTQNSPLASYFSAVRLPILLPSSSFPRQHFRLRPKHAVRDTRNQLWPYLP